MPIYGSDVGRKGTPPAEVIPVLILFEIYDINSIGT